MIPGAVGFPCGVDRENFSQIERLKRRDDPSHGIRGAGSTACHLAAGQVQAATENNIAAAGIHLVRFDGQHILARDKRMTFCAAVDRNGYLPVHNKIYSQPQRPGDVQWNTANCRNRRIFDDRAGLSAGRVVRPYLIQNYPRNMGDRIDMMWEIDAPIRVFGKKWGGFRTAYKL